MVIKFTMADIIDQIHLTVRNHFIVMMFFNCYVRMYVFSSEGFLLLQGIVQLHEWISCRQWSEVQFTPISRNGELILGFRTGSLPSLYILPSIDHDQYVSSKLICTLKKVRLNAYIHLISFQSQRSNTFVRSTGSLNRSTEGFGHF